MPGSGKGSVTGDRAQRHGELTLILSAHYHQLDSLQCSPRAPSSRPVLPSDTDKHGA